MQIFAKRPLFTSLTVFLAVYTISYFLTPTVKNIFILLTLIILMASFVLFILLKRDEKYTSFLVCICALTSALAILLSYTFFNIKQEKYLSLSGKDCTVEALVISETYNTGNISGYNIYVKELDGEKYSHKAILECAYNADLSRGDFIIVTATASSFEANGYGRFNEKLSRLSDGIFVSYVSEDQNFLHVTEENVQSIRIFFANINAELSKILRSNIEGEAGNFASAILLGNKNHLSDVTVRDFSRAGVSHILALSGMHMSVIMGALMLILKKLGVKRKYIAMILTFVAIGYLFITGLSLSATRAVIMLLWVYLSYLCFDPADSLTSLSIAAFVIVTTSPGAILDAGFWMSYSATLGILVYIPSYNRFMSRIIGPVSKYKKLLRPVLSFMSALAAGIFAIIPLILVMCVFIREMSWWSVLSSAVLSLPTSLVLLLSLLFLPLYKIPYVSWVIAKAISFLSGLIFSYCSAISHTENAVFSLNYDFSIFFAIIIGIALAYSLIFKARNLFISLTPFCVAVLVFFGSIFAFEFNQKDNVKITYLNCSSVSDVIVMANKGDAVICDLSRGSISAFNKALDAVYESRATEINAVMLSRYSNYQPSALTELFGNKIVRELWLPYPKNESDYLKLKPIISVAEKFDVTVKVYNDLESLTVFENVKIEKSTGEISRSQTPLDLVTIYTKVERVTYIPPAFNECESINILSQSILKKSDYVIFGDTGSKTKTEYLIPESNSVKVIILPDEIRAAYLDPESANGKLVFMAKDHFIINLQK